MPLRRLALALLAAVLACGGDAGEGVVLRLFLWRPEDPGAWDEALRRFEARHPGVRVEREIGPNNSTQLHDLLSQKLRNRDASVDVFLMDVVWTAEFARAGWARRLDDAVPPAERARFFPGCLAAVTFDGALWGVPFVADAGVLYYRRDLVAAAPATWPELVERARAVVAEHPDVHGYSAQLKQYEGLVCNLLEVVRARGGRLLEPDSPATVAAVTFVRDRIVGELAPRGVLTYEEQESLDLFRGGGAVFHRNWPYAWAACADAPVAGKVGLAPLPAFPGGESVSALGGWNLGVSAYSRHPEEAAALAAFLASAEIQRHFTLATGKPPPRPALYADPEVRAAYPHFRELEAVVARATPRPQSPIYPRLSHILQRYLHRAIARPDSDVAALLGEAARELAAARAGR